MTERTPGRLATPAEAQRRTRATPRRHGPGDSDMADVRLIKYDAACRAIARMLQHVHNQNPDEPAEPLAAAHGPPSTTWALFRKSIIHQRLTDSAKFC